MKEEEKTMSIQLTESARRNILETMEKEKVAGLRLGVQGGGCSGLSYVVRYEKQPGPRDQIFEFEGARVFVDPKSYAVLKGMRLDYKETLMERGFRFENPNAQKTCSCGTSFLA